MTTQDEYAAALGSLPQTEASPDDVLALEPNRMEDAQSGPDPQISATAYVEWTKPDGDTFVAPLSNAETYERKGFTRGAEVDIPDLVAYQAEKAATPAAAPQEAPSG